MAESPPRASAAAWRAPGHTYGACTRGRALFPACTPRSTLRAGGRFPCFNPPLRPPLFFSHTSSHCVWCFVYRGCNAQAHDEMRASAILQQSNVRLHNANARHSAILEERVQSIAANSDKHNPLASSKSAPALGVGAAGANVHYGAY